MYTFYIFSIKNSTGKILNAQSDLVCLAQAHKTAPAKKGELDLTFELQG
jgi:hypothetical protein